MAIRTDKDLLTHPCLYKLKDFERSPTTQVNTTVTKVKKQIPKLDENGNVVYKTVTIPVKSGCACKGNQTTTMKEQSVPEMVDAWVEVPANQINPANDTRFAICKLYGTVKRVICQNCKTYKKK